MERMLKLPINSEIPFRFLARGHDNNERPGEKLEVDYVHAEAALGKLDGTTGIHTTNTRGETGEITATGFLSYQSREADGKLYNVEAQVKGTLKVEVSDGVDLPEDIEFVLSCESHDLDEIEEPVDPDAGGFFNSADTMDQIISEGEREFEGSWVPQYRCKECSQLDVGQEGEYPCPSCGVPTQWSELEAGDPKKYREIGRIEAAWEARKFSQGRQYEGAFIPIIGHPWRGGKLTDASEEIRGLSPMRELYGVWYAKKKLEEAIERVYGGYFSSGRKRREYCGHFHPRKKRREYTLQFVFNKKTS